MESDQLLCEVMEQLQSQGYSVHLHDDRVLVDCAEDDIEIVFVPQRFTGVDGGTIEVGYVDAGEYEFSASLFDTTIQEVVDATVVIFDGFC